MTTIVILSDNQKQADWMASRVAGLLKNVKPEQQKSIVMSWAKSAGASVDVLDVDDSEATISMVVNNKQAEVKRRLFRSEVRA